MVEGYNFAQPQHRLTTAQIWFINELAKLKSDAQSGKLNTQTSPSQKQKQEWKGTSEDFFEKFAPTPEAIYQSVQLAERAERERARRIMEDFRAERKPRKIS